MRSWTFKWRFIHLYLHILAPRIDSDGCPLRTWEWNIVVGNRMFNGDAYWTEAKPRRRGL